MAKDVDLFKAAMKDVAPLRGRRPVARAGRLPDMAKSVGNSSRATPPRQTIRPARRDERPSFDRDIDRALSRGRREPEARLDLHGLTLAAAERAVVRFLEEAADRDLRIVLVVTGKGWREEGGRIVEGRIRGEFPGWLERPPIRASVRGVKPAHQRHGGTGAFYVLLRRRSSASNRSLRATPQR